VPLGPAVAIVVMLLLAGALGFAVFRSDLKREFLTKHSPSLDGRNTSSVPVDLPIPAPEAMRIAQDALLTTCGHGPIEVVGGVTLGWTDAAFLGIGWAPQQVAIRVDPLSESQSRLTCMSRPRYKMTVSDIGRSHRMAEEIASKVRNGSPR